MLENYYEDIFGVVHQKDVPNKCTYDLQYIKDRYVKYGDLCNQMSAIRLAFLLGAIRTPVNTILDIGYGNGAFLDICSFFGMETYGYDITGFEISSNHIVLNSYKDMFNLSFDVVCLFDSLEHLDNPNEIIKNLDARFIGVSVPNYRPDLGDEWFKSWKHRREGEHLHHFSLISLIAFFEFHEYKFLASSYIEDSIRYDPDNFPNILSAVFERR